MDKIKKLSCFLKWVFTLVFWAWPIVLFVIWFQDEKNFPGAIGVTIANSLPRNLSFYVTHPLSLETKIWGFLVSGIPACVGMFIAFSLMRLFACYERGGIFTQGSIVQIRRVGMMMFVWALLNPLYQILMSFVLTFDNPVGQRMISLSFDFDYFRNLVLAGLVFLIAHIMREALKLKDEQALTI